MRVGNTIAIVNACILSLPPSPQSDEIDEKRSSVPAVVASDNHRKVAGTERLPGERDRLVQRTVSLEVATA